MGVSDAMKKGDIVKLKSDQTSKPMLFRVKEVRPARAWWGARGGISEAASCCPVENPRDGGYCFRLRDIEVKS